MDLLILARDASGTYEVLRLRAPTRGGQIVQVLDPRSPSGLHRTWHGDGRVHDRSTNPSSTTSQGRLASPNDAMRELWVDRILVEGELKELSPLASTPERPGVLIDFLNAPKCQRVRVWYTQVGDAAPLLEEVRRKENVLLERVDTGYGLARVAVVTTVPRAT